MEQPLGNSFGDFGAKHHLENLDLDSPLSESDRGGLVLQILKMTSIQDSKGNFYLQQFWTVHL